MMSEPVIEPSTRQRLENAINNPPHALLLTGQDGIGKTTLVDWFVSHFDVGHHILTMVPEKGKTTIGIEAIRSIEHFISLKLPATSTINRIIRIDDAHALTVEAQNAMLKLLEEPPVGTLIVMTSDDRDALLTTVRSRLQILDVQKPATADLRAIIKNSDVDRILALSAGLPGLTVSLAENDQSHPLVQAAHTARQLLQSSAFERLSMIDPLAKSSSETKNLLYILMQMAHAALLSGKNLARWQQVLSSTYEVETSLKQGAQPKLALTKLMLSL